MRRFFPHSLAGQTILVLFIGLIVTHVISMVIYSFDRGKALSEMGGNQIARHMANIAHLVNESPVGWRERIVEALNDPPFRVSLSPESLIAPGGEKSRRAAIIRKNMELQLQGETVHRIVVQFLDFSGIGPADNYRIPMRWVWMFTDWVLRDSPMSQSLRVSIKLKDGQWINLSSTIPESGSFWATSTVVSALLMAVAVLLLSIWVVRRLAAPLGALARASKRLGKNVDAPPLPEVGPIEVRQASRAFNDMQNRLRSFIENRTRMLAAISHDLRTPITLLRLRAELIEDEEVQGKMIASLDQMEDMIASTLAFAREDAENEVSRNVDFAALLGSICDDMSDVGLPVDLDTADRIFYECRPQAMSRALTNLIENAVKYGGGAHVRLKDCGQFLKITVEDDGPGIPVAQIDEVFTPFYRVDQSRNQETGGIGLGLSVARTVIQAHGGEITLANRHDGGLRVSVQLPR